jgi:hypothetical protein
VSRIDLHLHTIHSDGSLSPSEVLKLAAKASVTALAITDHDITSGIPEAMATGQELGIEVIPGVEISSFDGRSELHILGYCLDWQDPLLQERLATLRGQLEDGVKAAGGVVIAEDAPRIATIGSVALPRAASASLLVQFDLAGIAVSAGSACSSGAMKASPVLAAMSVSEDVASSFLRVSFGPGTSATEITRFLREWHRIAARAKAA